MNQAGYVCDLLRRGGCCAGFLLMAALASLSSNRAGAEGPAPLVATVERPMTAAIASPDDIVRWIDDLGNDAFTVRQSAASHLMTAGMPAREPLLAIVDGPDPEKRAAARRLIALIDQSEFHRRL